MKLFDLVVYVLGPRRVEHKLVSTFGGSLDEVERALDDVDDPIGIFLHNLPREQVRSICIEVWEKEAGVFEEGRQVAEAWWDWNQELQQMSKTVTFERLHV
jgi:hypothetical protein